MPNRKVIMVEKRIVITGTVVTTAIDTITTVVINRLTIQRRIAIVVVVTANPISIQSN